jgi:alkylation response protein AidB-like acyl-CoA dehydrogenase
MINFLTEEHHLISESARQVFADLSDADTKQRQTVRSRIAGAVVGRALAELGLFGTGADASMCSAQIQVLVAREAGAACLPFPTLEMLAVHALAAHSEKLRVSGLLGVDGIATLANTRSAASLLEGSLLVGSASLVAFVGMAAVAVIAARRGDDAVLVCASPAAIGVISKPRASVEPDYSLHDLAFASVATGLVLGKLDDGSDAAGFLELRGSLLAAAEISGARRHMIRMTRDYLLARSQFGQLLGSNQALKHSLADAHVRVEAMIAAIDYAAAACDAGSPEAAAAVAAAKHFAGRAGKTIADNMLQLHGAIGYTMEFPLHLFMRRVYRLGVSHGSSQLQAERLYAIFHAEGASA